MKKKFMFLATAVCLTVQLHALMPECIVIPESATALERNAAGELAGHLQKITGKKFVILPESQQNGKSAFLIGATAAAKSEFPDKFAPDAIALRTKGNDIIITGDSRRGVLYAVYTLLEKYAGVRWYTSDVTVIPENPALDLPNLDEVYAPVLKIREVHFTDAYKGVFPARLKSNGHFVKLPQEFGGNEKIIGFCHTFGQILPAARYFKDHPEWYSMQKGKRAVPRWHQLCLTNSEMRREFVKVCLQMIAKNPDAKVISVSQNDGLGRCECPECLAVEKEEGSPAGPVIRFVNAVAAEIGKVHPDMLIDTLAYSYTRPAPRKTKPAPNVSIRYCDIEADFGHSIESGKVSAPIRRDVKSWSKIANQMLVWHYVSNFGNQLTPHPTFLTYKEDINFYIRNHAVGMFLEGDTHTDLMDFSQMRVWVLGHLLWDPSQDQEALMMDFLNGYYGDAGKHLREYLQFIHDTFRKSGKTVSCFTKKSIQWLSIEKIIEAEKFFDAALQAVEGDETLTERVKRSRISLYNAALLQYPYLQSINKTGVFTPEKWSYMADEVSRFAKKYFFNRTKAVIGIWNYETRFPDMLASTASTPKKCLDLPRDEYVDYQEMMFCVAGQNAKNPQITIVDDPNASNGKAAKITGPCPWWIQQQFHVPVKKGEKWQAVISLRMDSPLQEKVALYAGYHDGKKEFGHARISVRSIRTHKYLDLVMPEVPAADNVYVFINPVAATAKTPIFIDRITLIRKKR